jgi:hypothetical protein
MAPRVWRTASLVLSTLCVFVACSSEDDAPNHDFNETPQATGDVLQKSQTVGPAGGTVSGGGATIDIPAGALPADTTITITSRAPSSVTLPTWTPTQVMGGTFAFGPDNIVFAKPVTITVGLAVNRPSHDPNALVVLMRSPTSANQWEPRGAGPASEDTVTAVTDHFSDWAPTLAPSSSCFAPAACAADAAAGGPVGIDCRVPASGGGVHCFGDKSPYTCTCDGQSTVLLTVDGPPSASTLSALAVACGAPCPTTSTPKDDGGGSGADGSAPSLDAAAGSDSSAPVDDDASAGIDASGGGADGSPGLDASSSDAGSATCPFAGMDASPQACESISTTCSDGHYYGISCTTANSACTCSVDGAAVRVVDSTCNGAWTACGFPKFAVLN